MHGNRRMMLTGLLAFIVWNAAFDLQVKWAGHRFVADQLTRTAQGQPVVTIAEGLQPSVARAAGVATAVTALLVAGMHLVARRNASR